MPLPRAWLTRERISEDDERASLGYRVARCGRVRGRLRRRNDDGRSAARGWGVGSLEHSRAGEHGRTGKHGESGARKFGDAVPWRFGESGPGGDDGCSRFAPTGGNRTSERPGSDEHAAAATNFGVSRGSDLQHLD